MLAAAQNQAQVKEQDTKNISQVNATNEADSDLASIRWSSKERLYLIMCVLLCGESNWSFVCEQLKRWLSKSSSRPLTFDRLV
jgi:hypothetical protein